MQKKYILFIIFGVSVLLLFAPSVHARKVGGFFGNSERIRCIQKLEKEITVKSDPVYPNLYTQPKLYSLCHKMSVQYFILGVGLKDDGYVIAEKDDAYQYIPLTKATIAEYQEKGILPNPLPEYSIPLSAYLVGYSLWLVVGIPLGGLVLLAVSSVFLGKLGRLINRRKSCRRCESLLTEENFSDGKCSECGEPIPA